MKLAFLSIAFAAALTAHSDAPQGNTSSAHSSPDEALRQLVDGNKRYASGTAQRPHQSVERRQQLSGGQQPIAVVLTCSDSRVAPELYFDQGLGDLFVLRNAGNVLDDHTIGSIEYAIEHLKVGLIVVVGHEKCGAVKATVEGGHAAGHIQSIVDSIEPALESCKAETGDKVDAVVRANAQRVATLLRRIEPILNARCQAGELKVVPARYDLDTGVVEVLNP